MKRGTYQPTAYLRMNHFMLKVFFASNSNWTFLQLQLCEEDATFWRCMHEEQMERDFRAVVALLYREPLKGFGQVSWMLQASWGRSGKQQQKQASPNLGSTFQPNPASLVAARHPSIKMRWAAGPIAPKTQQRAKCRVIVHSTCTWYADSALSECYAKLELSDIHIHLKKL